MKLEPHLPSLPSISELLEHPRVRGVVERINRTTVAQRAAGFLDELRSSLAQRDDKSHMPSVAQLAERLARRLLGPAAGSGETINATGVVAGDRTLAPPLAESAVHAMLRTASEYHRLDDHEGRSIERTLCRLAGAEAALALGSYAGAVQCCAAAARGGAVRFDAAPLAGLLNPAAHGYQPVEGLAQRIAGGADLVIADGAGLLGGPPCGLILGRRQLVDAVAKSEATGPLALDPYRAAALAATLELYDDGPEDAAMLQVPVWQLLSTPLANLEQRAARIAPLLAECSALASAEPRSIESIWAHGLPHDAKARSWAVALRPAAGDCQSLAARLRRGPHPIAAAVAADAVLLDLRAMFPRWDQQLAAAFDSLAE